MTYVVYDPYKSLCRCGHAFSEHAIKSVYRDECHGLGPDGESPCKCELFVAEQFIPKGTIGNG